jgi:hypothetical protein
MVAGSRARRWPLGRRLLYAAAAPAIAVVLAARVLPLVPRSAGLILLVVVGAAIQALGEAVGYVGGDAGDPERSMAEYELFKARYAARG